MSDLTLVEDNFFTVASETFADNLSASISAGATVVPVLSGVEYATGDAVVLTVDPGTVNEATFIGKKDTTNQFIECIWTEGNLAVGHDSGAVIIDYDSATHHGAQTKGILKFANQDGSLKTDPIRTALGLGSEAVNGWEVIPYTLQVASGYNQGNGSYEVTVANNDLTDEYSVGQKIRLERSTTAPTQCADFESGSSQYASKSSPSGISFTDDFTCEAWIKPESYTGLAGHIISRYNGTSGWGMQMNPYGALGIYGWNAGSTNFRGFYTSQSLPLSRWLHVAQTLDMSGNISTAYINGVSVSVVGSTGGTAPTALIQAGNLSVGAANGTEFFDGKVSDARVWNVVRTGLQIRDNMNQQLVGSETNLVAYFKLDGDFNDSTSSANHLTGSGGAVATDVDNPFNDTQYGVISAISYSAPNTTLMIYTGNSQVIPNQTLDAPYYSTQATPYGFPIDKSKWIIEALLQSSYSQSAPTINTWYNVGDKLNVPIGSWKLSYSATIAATEGSGSNASAFVDISTSPSTSNLGVQSPFYRRAYLSAAPGITAVTHLSPVYVDGDVSVASATPFYINLLQDGTIDTLYIWANQGAAVFKATPNFLGF